MTQASGADRRKWTASEDQSLLRAVRKHGSSDKSANVWAEISSEVAGDRSTRACKKRWYYTLDPTLKKGRWSAEEDNILRQAYLEYGPQWHKIAPRIAGRNDEQIAKRWRDVLSPDLQPEMPWTSHEDALLRSLFLQLGSKWTLMADSFPGRNGIQCRNRFRRLNNSRACKRGLVSGLWQNDDAKVPNAPDRASSEMTISSSGQEQSVELDPANGRHVNIRATSSCSPGDTLDLAVALPADAVTHPGAGRQTHCSTEPWDLPSSHAYDFSALPVSPPDMALDFTHTEFGSWLQDSDNNRHPTPAPAPGSVPATPFAEWFVTRILGDETVRPSQGNSSPVYAPPSQGTIEDSTSSTCDPTQNPIRDMYGLCVALEQGQETLTLSTDLIRSLIRDAARR